jgi:O-antigen ligase
MGYAVVFILSAMRQWTSRKALILLVGVVTMGAVVPLVVSSFQTRFAAEGASAAAGDDYDERGAYKTVATMMLTDHPMGVGANHYTLVANMRGYNFRAGVALTYSSLAGNVHNIYYLIAAETGYLGVFAFVLLLLQPLIVAFRCAWRYRGDLRGDLLLGLAVALLTVYIHSYFEWIFITFQAQYIFALDVGLVAGLAQQLGYWRRPSPRRIRLGAGAFSSIRPPRKAAVPGLGARHPTIVGSDGGRPSGLARR